MRNKVMAELVPVEQPIIGTREQLEQALRTQHTLGRLVSDPATLRPRKVSMHQSPGRAPAQMWAVTAVVLVPKPAPGMFTQGRRRAIGWSAFVLAGLGILGLIAWGVVALVGALLTAVTAVAPALGGVVAIGLIVGALALIGGGTCTTIIKVTHKH